MHKRDVKRILKRFKYILGSYDIDKLDIKEDRDEIIMRVLNYGNWEDIKALMRLYSEEEIREVVAKARRGVWLKKVLNFWVTILNIEMDREKFERAIMRVNIGAIHQNLYNLGERIHQKL